MRGIFIFLLPIILIAGCSSTSGQDNSKDAEDSSAKANSNNVVNGNEQASVDKEEGKALAKTNDEDNDNTEKNTSSKSNDEDKSNLTNKEKYMQMLEDLEEELEPLDEKAENGTQRDMEEAEDDLFERWDVALNEVYDALESDLSKEDMDALRKEQHQWIEKRDKYAKQQAEEYEDGSLYGFALTEAKKEMTIDRCYELVEEYMD